MSKTEKPQTIFFTDEEDTTHFVSTDDWFDDEEEIIVSGAAVVYCIAVGIVLALIGIAFCFIFYH